MGVVCKLDIGKTFDCYQVKVLFLFFFMGNKIYRYGKKSNT